MRKGGRLSRKYIIILVSLVTGTLLASGALSIYSAFEENKQALVALQREKARGAAYSIEKFVKEIESQLGWTTQPQLVAAAAASEQRRVDSIRLLKQVIDAGTKAGKSVSVCGEMSSDINFTLLLLGLGLRNFSVVPFIIPDLKKLIRSVSIQEAQAIAARALTFDDGAACLEFLKAETQKYLPDTA